MLEQEPIDAATNLVLFAISDPRWDFRTIGSLSRQTGFQESEVEDILKTHPKQFRSALVPDADGNMLFTLRSRPVSFRERLARLRFFVAKSPN